MDRTRFEESKEAYALGALPTEELRAFEAFLEQNPALQSEVDDLVSVAALLAVSAQDQEPPPSLKSSIMDSVRSEAAARAAANGERRSDGARRYRSRDGFGASLAGIFGRLPVRFLAYGVAALLFVGLLSWNGLLQMQMEDLEDDNAVLQARMEEEPDSSASQVYAMSGEGEMAQTSAEVVSFEAGRSVLIAENLPSIPEGRTYQIWVINGEEASPSGVFEPNGDPVSAVISTPIEDADVVAVTVEPAGGSPQPTNQPMLSAEV